MRIPDPCKWVAERLAKDLPTFAIRINDGEMLQMFRTEPDGREVGTRANPTKVHYDCGDALRLMVEEFGYEDTNLEAILIGCSWNTERADEMAGGEFAKMVRLNDLEGANWCHEHWQMEGIRDGSTMALLDQLQSTGKVVLVACAELMPASARLNCPQIICPSADSWQGREEVYQAGTYFACSGGMFIWCGGGGLKATAWRLFKEFPQSSHIDLGHLFNAAVGLTGYGWMERRDGWWNDYYTKFVPWFKVGGDR